LIVTDDQGYRDMTCHGNPFLKTLNIDRLATQSTRLDEYKCRSRLHDRTMFVEGQADLPMLSGDKKRVGN